MTTQDKALVALAEALEKVFDIGESNCCPITGASPPESRVAKQALQTHAKAIQEAKERLKQ